MQYESREESIGPQLQDVARNTTMSVLLHNLRKYVQYELRVLAYTRIGDGVLSRPEVKVKTDEDSKLDHIYKLLTFATYPGNLPLPL